MSFTCWKSKHKNIWANIGDARIWESDKQKLLGYLFIEHYPFTRNFQIYVRNLCFSKVLKLYDSNTKEGPNENLH